MPFPVSIVALPSKDLARVSEVNADDGYRRLIGESATVVRVEGDMYIVQMKDARFDFGERLWFYEHFALSPQFVRPL
jgi:hypothetical protein